MGQHFFRAMTLSDVDRVYEIELESFSPPWSKDSFVRELTENKLARYFVIEINGFIVAYGGMWLIVDEAHVTNIAVAKDFRGLGMGNILVERMADMALGEGAENMTLEVRVSNERAINLYKKFGFEEYGIRPNYYIENNEDALIMWKKLI